MDRAIFLKELDELNRKFTDLRPELELTVRDPQMGVEGYVVVFNTAPGKLGPLGPCGKGGTRITPNLSIDEVKMLASRMALKNAAAQLYFGGCKSGIKADPAQPGFEKIYRRFVKLASPNLVEHGGVFGGFGFDVGGRPEHALWACDELKSTRCITGKPVELGGTDYDREGIAGLGVAVAGKTMMEKVGTPVAGSTFAVQGLGAMGAAVVRYFSEFGGKLKSVSDLRLGGSVEFKDDAPKELISSISALDIESTKRIIEKGNFARTTDLSAPIYADVDIVFPSATQEVINSNNVGKIRAKFISEGANNPTSVEAYSMLHKRGVHVVPDFIANPGGIIAAYVEMTSTLTPKENLATRGNVTKAKELTIQKITENVSKLHETMKRYDVMPTEAGRYMALKFMLG